MKIFLHLFALYILMLPLVGMAANDGCDQVAHAEHVIKAGTNHEEDHEEDCAPFCSCSCCFHTAPSHFELPRLLPAPFSYMKTNYASSIYSYYPIGIMASIWQPPRY